VAKPKKLKKKGAAAAAKKRKRDIPGTHERACVVDSKSVFVCMCACANSHIVCLLPFSIYHLHTLYCRRRQ
jgi:hypothetical protein